MVLFLVSRRLPVSSSPTEGGQKKVVPLSLPSGSMRRGRKVPHEMAAAAAVALQPCGGGGSSPPPSPSLPQSKHPFSDDEGSAGIKIRA